MNQWRISTGAAAWGGSRPADIGSASLACAALGSSGKVQRRGAAAVLHIYVRPQIQQLAGSLHRAPARREICCRLEQQADAAPTSSFQQAVQPVEKVQCVLTTAPPHEARSGRSAQGWDTQTRVSAVVGGRRDFSHRWYSQAGCRGPRTALSIPRPIAENLPLFPTWLQKLTGRPAWARGAEGAWWRASRVGERAGRRQGATAHQPASTSVRMVSGLLFLAAWRMLSGVKPRRCAAIFALRTGGGGARVRAAAGSRAAPGGELGGAHRRSTIPRVLGRVWPAPGAVWLHLPKRNVQNVRIRALKACARWITLGGSVWSHQNGRKVGARQ